MLKKVWLLFMLWSVLMVLGCSGGIPEDNTESVVVSDDVVAVDDSDTSVRTEQSEISESEEQSGDSSNVEASNTEEPTVDTTTMETDTEPSTTEAPSEPETVTTEPATSPEEQQPTTPEQTPPATSTEVSATEDETPPVTDDRGNPADGSPVFEITFNIPQAEYVGYDADRVARLAVKKCKAVGMITLPENLDRLLVEGKITQEEYDEYYPYDGCGYYSVFVETNLNLASTISGERLCSEEEIADYIAGMMVLEVEPYFYIECAGVYQGNSVEFYEFRCYR
ncbi:MAG: hypothetical protein J6C19_02165 [Lachnospiraceae bacterium]|nr:hypothetical protein [Lachnospiraceae bacterium]